MAIEPGTIRTSGPWEDFAANTRAVERRPAIATREFRSSTFFSPSPSEVVATPRLFQERSIASRRGVGVVWAAIVQYTPGGRPANLNVPFVAAREAPEAARSLGQSASLGNTTSSSGRRAARSIESVDSAVGAIGERDDASETRAQARPQKARLPRHGR